MDPLHTKFYMPDSDWPIRQPRFPSGTRGAPSGPSIIEMGHLEESWQGIKLFVNKSQIGLQRREVLYLRLDCIRRRSVWKGWSGFEVGWFTTILSTGLASAALAEKTSNNRQPGSILIHEKSSHKSFISSVKAQKTTTDQRAQKTGRNYGS